MWTSVKAKAAATRVVAYTDEIPGEMILVRRKLPKRERAALKKAVLSLNDAAAVLSQISQGELTVTGVFDASARDLNGVAKVVMAVRQKRVPKAKRLPN